MMRRPLSHGILQMAATLLCERHPNPQFHFEGSLVDPRLRALTDINAPSKLARYLSRDGA